jgi:hypothetical protein
VIRLRASDGFSFLIAFISLQGRKIWSETMNIQTKLSVSILAIALLAPAVSFAGTGRAQGCGVAKGSGVLHGTGTVHGKGIAIGHNANGERVIKRGSGTLSGTGTVIGRGTFVGCGKAAGTGKVRGFGTKRRGF